MDNRKFSLQPIQILGIAITIGVLIAAVTYEFAIVKPVAIRETAAGQWSIWREIVYELVLIPLWATGYFGYILYALPLENWSWRRAARSGIHVMISGAGAGILLALAGR